MSEENTENTEFKDPTAGLKQELDTKFGSIDQQIKAMNQSFSQLTEAIVQSKTQETATKETPPDYENMTAEQLEARIQQRAEKLIDEKLTSSQKKQATLQSTLYDLHGEYPELSKSSSELSKAMVDAHKKLPAHLQETPEGYRMATLMAAQNTGTLPKSKRPKSDTDDFVMGAGNNQSGSKRTGKLDSSVLEAAKMMGLDTSDPKVVARLTDRAKRNFNGYR